MDEVNHWPRLQRVERRRHKQFLKFKGVKPTKRQWMVCVETTVIEIPEWAKLKAEKKLSSSEHHVWFRGRNNGRAKILERQDKAAGGSPELTAVEWRLCAVCGRMLLSLEAAMRRRMDERYGREVPCSSECK